MNAVLVEDAAALEALAPAWWELWRRCPAATPFQSPAWLLPWWQVFAPGRLCTLAVHDGERLVALAPVYLEDGAYGRRLLPIGIGITDYLDVLLDPAVPEAGGVLSRAAADLVPDWESWELEELAPGATGLDLPPPSGMRDGVSEHSACPVLDLTRDEAIPSGKRRKLRMTENRVARRGGQVASIGLQDVPAFLDDLVRLHGARWATRGEGGVLAEDSVRRFHALALPHLVKAGLARLSILTIEDAVAGAYYGLGDVRRAYAYLGGFDPDYAFESPGTILVGRAIGAAREEGAGAFHFLRGREAYKYDWGATDRPNRRRSIRRHG